MYPFIYVLMYMELIILVACLNYRTRFSHKSLCQVFQQTPVNRIQSGTGAWNTVTAVPDQTGHEPLFRACAPLR